MNRLISSDNLKMSSHLIESVKDNSDERMDRVYITFKNGETLSIIKGDGSYGFEQGLFEIQPSKPELLKSFDANSEYNDSVEGHLTIDDLNYYINKIGGLK